MAAQLPDYHPALLTLARAIGPEWRELGGPDTVLVTNCENRAPYSTAHLPVTQVAVRHCTNSAHTAIIKLESTVTPQRFDTIAGWDINTAKPFQGLER